MKTLCVFLLLALSGCFFVVDDGGYDYDRPDDETYYSGEVWFDDVYVSCNYDHYSGYSDWYFYAAVDSTYGYDEIYAVDVVVDDLSAYGTDETFYLYESGYGIWEGVVSSWYYDCYYPYDFRFIAYDYYGYSTDAWVAW